MRAAAVARSCSGSVLGRAAATAYAWGLRLRPRPRLVRGVSLGAGIALAKTYEADLFIPTVVGASAGLVYTHAYDAALGGADFLGLELSFLVGGDYLGELVRRGADD